MRSFGEGGKEPLSWIGETGYAGRALSGNREVAVETEVSSSSAA
jgi:hypothetical protein